MDSSEESGPGAGRVAVAASVTSLVGLAGIASTVAAVAMPTAAERLLFGGGLVLLAAILDAADGPLARTLGAESRFGRGLDAVCDAVAFGLGPAALLVTFSLVEPPAFESVSSGENGDVIRTVETSARVAPWLGWGLAIAHLLAAVFRMAWAGTSRIDRGGLPAPLAGAFVASVAVAWGVFAAREAVGEAVTSGLGTAAFTLAARAMPVLVIFNLVAMLSAWSYPRPTRRFAIPWGFALLGVTLFHVLEPSLTAFLPLVVATACVVPPPLAWIARLAPPPADG